MHKNTLSKLKQQIKKQRSLLATSLVASPTASSSSLLRPTAAFDADGTLWPCDVGKDFFHYQVEKGLLKKKCADPLKEFRLLVENQGRSTALKWLAQVQADFPLEQLQGWVSDFLRERPFKVFGFQKHLIEWLIGEKVCVFVVSSSLKWVLDQALCGWGLSKKNIIGVETQVKKGIITDKPILPAPIHDDKVRAFQSHTGLEAPWFSAGNTLSDRALLESARGIRLVVSTARPGDRNYQSEQSMLQLARKKNWFYQEGMPELI